MAEAEADAVAEAGVATNVAFALLGAACSLLFLFLLFIPLDVQALAIVELAAQLLDWIIPDDWGSWIAGTFAGLALGALYGVYQIAVERQYNTTA